MRWVRSLAAAVVGAALALSAQAPLAAETHPILEVTIAPAVSAPHGGRLLIFAEPYANAVAKARGKEIQAVDVFQLAEPHQAVAAVDVEQAQPGGTLAIDLDGIAFPQAFSRLPPGDYAV